MKPYLKNQVMTANQFQHSVRESCKAIEAVAADTLTDNGAEQQDGG